ncbi:MAG: DUF2066 domain-containing protein [Proteobacteria bacterium]|nr:DUF2066 domain-containing protein [Pseudomonadota bacterium]NOG60131.1 DUF2066 domain-containing protein [Pseudomonadota bacterium]
MKLKISLFLCLFVFATQPVYAIKVSGLYQATAPVADESTAKRNPAVKQALIQVLIKLTGDRNIARSSSISNLIERPDRFVQQFRYQQAPIQANEQIPSKELWVQFDESALNGALRSYGLAIWGKERPSILVWLAHEKDKNRQLVSFEESPEYIDMLDRHAAARGVSLLFPLLDLEDTSRMNVSDVWGGFKEPVLNASIRYQSDVVLTARLIQTLPTLWESQWSVYINEQEMYWTTQGELAEIALEEGINELADRLASQYVNTVSTGTEVLELIVSNINSIDGYAKTLAYLESLQAISDVKVTRVTEDEVSFEVISRGGETALNQTIALGKTLELVSNNEQLNYRLLGR